MRKTSRHDYDIPLSYIDQSYVKRFLAFNFVLGPALWSSKAAILALYLRLFSPKLWLRHTSYATLLVTFLFYGIQIPLSAAFCTPGKRGSWGFDVIQKCDKIAVMRPIYGVVGLAADVVLFILPIPVIYGLNLPPNKKLGLFFVFFMALLYVYDGRWH